MKLFQKSGSFKIGSSPLNKKNTFAYTIENSSVCAS